MAGETTTRSAEIAAQSGGWLAVARGEMVRIVDVEGAQIADTFAAATDRAEWLSARHTRAANRRLFPKLGQAFFSNRLRPILTLVADTSPGVHDMLWMSCDPLLYQSLGVIGHHPSCHENFKVAASDAGWTPPEVPDPVNFFQNTQVTGEGEMVTRTALSAAGNAVTLRAEMDLVLVVTACAFDLAPINGEKCTGVRIEVLGAGATA